jgi:hypothetical protein
MPGELLVVVGVVCSMPGEAGELAFSLIDQVSVPLSGIAGRIGRGRWSQDRQPDPHGG